MIRHTRGAISRHFSNPPAKACAAHRDDRLAQWERACEPDDNPFLLARPTNPVVSRIPDAHKVLWNRGQRAKVPRPFHRSIAHVLSIIEAAGWPIWFIIITSVVALAIIGERFWSLRTALIAPRDILPATIREY